MIAAALLLDVLWSVAIHGEATAWGPDGEAQSRVIEAVASWEEGGEDEGFFYQLAYEAGETYRLSCPWEALGGFVEGSLDDACSLRVRHAGSEEWTEGAAPEQREDAFFPFHLLSLIGGERVDPSSTTSRRWRIAEGMERVDTVEGGPGESPTPRRQRHNGSLRGGGGPLPVGSGRVVTRMDVGIPDPEGFRWMPFVTSILTFWVEGEDPPPPDLADLPNPEVLIRTGKGEMLAEIFLRENPSIAGNFLLLVREGFYDATICHRVVSGFVDQCGDPTGTGWGGPSYALPDAFMEGNRHDAFVLSMANAGPDTNGSQWFIPVERTDRVANLDSKHAVFGRLIWGEEVALAINSTEVGKGDRPVEPLHLFGVTESALWLGPLEHQPAPPAGLAFLEVEGSFVWGSRTLGVAEGRASWDSEAGTLVLQGVLSGGEREGEPVEVHVRTGPEGAGFFLSTLGSGVDVPTPPPTEGSWPGAWVWEGAEWRLTAWAGDLQDPASLFHLLVQRRKAAGGPWLFALGAAGYIEDNP